MVNFVSTLFTALGCLDLVASVSVPETKFGILHSLEQSDVLKKSPAFKAAQKQLSVVSVEKGSIFSIASNKKDESITNAFTALDGTGTMHGAISANDTSCFHGYCAHIEGHYDLDTNWYLWQTVMKTFLHVAEYPQKGEECNCHINNDGSVTCQTCYVKQQKLPKKIEVRIQGPEHQASWMSIELKDPKDENVCKTMTKIAEGIAGYFPYINAITGQLSGLCGGDK